MRCTGIGTEHANSSPAEGAWHFHGAERRPRGLGLMKERRGQIKRRFGPEDLVRTWLLFLMPRKALGEFQVEKYRKWPLILGVQGCL